jgi:hypothetical protein
MRPPYLTSSGQFRMSVKRCESPFASCALARIVSFGPIWIRVDQLLSRTLGEHERERLHGTQVLKLRGHRADRADRFAVGRPERQGGILGSRHRLQVDRP